LVNAIRSKLAFDLTEGLNPGTNKCYSVCSYDHAEHASAAFTNLKLKLKKSSEKLKFLLGLVIQKLLVKVQLSNIF
jgi:sulfide:quinone oxidoreductase